MKTLSLLILILTVSFGVQAQKSKWKKAQKDNTIEAYQNFIDTYPQSDFLLVAKDKLINLEYSKAIKLNTSESLRNFIEKYSDNKLSKEVFEKLINLEKDIATKDNNYKSLHDFIKKLPDSQFKSNAIDSLEKLDYKLAISNNILDEYYTFLKEYPNSKFFPQINLKIDTLKYEQLISALDNNKIDSLKIIIPAIQNINESLFYKGEPIFHAKSKEATELLLSNGVDINYLSSGGQNCLFYALGDAEYFRFLVSKGADINLTDSINGANLLHFSIVKENPEIVEYLLKNSNIDINSKIKDGRSVIDLVKKSNNEIKQLFMENPSIGFKTKLEMADNEQKRQLLKKPNVNLSNYPPSSSFIVWLYEQKDYDFAIKLLEKNGYRLVANFKDDTRFTIKSFKTKYHLNIENKNIILLYSLESDMSTSRGWILLDNIIYILGSYRLFNTFTDFEFGKNTMVFVTN